MEHAPAAAATMVTGFLEVDGHTEYTIETTLRGERVLSKHRYSDFVRLHDSLVTGPLASTLPAKFPVPKKFPVFDGVKTERVNQLSDYLRDLVAGTPGSEIAPELHTFLRLGTPPAWDAAAVDAVLQATNSGSDIMRSGWLEKRGQNNTAFRKRWFQLQGSVLTYWERAPTHEEAKSSKLRASLSKEKMRGASCDSRSHARCARTRRRHLLFSLRAGSISLLGAHIEPADSCELRISCQTTTRVYALQASAAPAHARPATRARPL